MDYFYNVFMNFLINMSKVWLCGFQWRDRNLSGFIKNVLVCVFKHLIGLERHEYDKIMTELSFLRVLYI